MKSFRVNGRLDKAGCDNRFDLRGKNECPRLITARRNMRVIERLYTDVIASQRQGSFFVVPNRECEHAVELQEAITTPLSECGKKNFSVAFSTKLMTERDQLLAKLSVVEDLSVEGEDITSVMRDHRLVAAWRCIND